MDDEGIEQRLSPSAPIVPAGGALRAPPVVDAEFKVVSPAGLLWRRCRDSWWAVGPYMAYCAALWGLAALVGWMVDRSRGG
ncbi:MAG: hypothetical protein ACXU82_10265 [Caulobacteraceae bacterium]